MITYSAIITTLFVIYFIGYYHQYNLRDKAQKKAKALKIPYDHYSHLMKAFAELSMWLHEFKDNETINQVRDKVNEVFDFDK